MIQWGYPQGAMIRVQVEGRHGGGSGEGVGVWIGGRAREAALVGTRGEEAVVGEGWPPSAAGMQGVEAAGLAPASCPVRQWAPPPPEREDSNKSNTKPPSHVAGVPGYSPRQAGRLTWGMAGATS